MLYFATRTAAREFAKKREHYTVVDCKDNPSVNGSRWAVRVLPQHEIDLDLKELLG